MWGINKTVVLYISVCEREMTHKSEQVCMRMQQHDMNSLLGIILHDETFDLDNVLRTLNAVGKGSDE